MTTTILLDSARVVSAWSMRDVLDYLESASAELLEYPPDCDSELALVCDRENRARAYANLPGGSAYEFSVNAQAAALALV